MRVPSFHLLLFKLGNSKWSSQVVCLKSLLVGQNTAVLDLGSALLPVLRPHAGETNKGTEERSGGGQGMSQG